MTAMTIAGPMLNGLSHPKIANIARLATTTRVIHSSFGQRRTDSPNKSSASALSLTLDRDQQPALRDRGQARFRRSARARAQPTRTSNGSTPQCCATPPQRPVSLASVALRRIVQIELMRSILPTGLPSNYQGRPPMLPAVGVNMEPFSSPQRPSSFG